MPTPTDLYRNGNTTGPRLDNVRDIDVETYDVSGVQWVRARVRGISCFDATAGNDLIHGKNWWRLPTGSAVLPGLFLINDNNPPGHWAFQPDVDMTRTAFTQLLTQQGTTVPNGGQWVGPSPNNWPGPNAGNEDEVGTVRTVGETTVSTPGPFSGKVHDFVLGALDRQIGSMQSDLDSEDDDDQRSDLTNDLVLYQLIRRHLAEQGPNQG